MRKSINSLEVAKPSGSFSQVLKVGDFIYISGQVGLDKDLKMPNSLNKQVKVIFDNLALLLKELDMPINQIVKASVYLKVGEDVQDFDDLYQANFKHPYPARTLVFVDALSHQDALVEISFEAIDLSDLEAMQACSTTDCKDCEV